jgi:hypothetical protein
MAKTIQCECGQWSGETCGWMGPADETTRVEFMPEHLRGSHEAAGNSGVYPHNGAVRISVSLACADLIVEHDGDWARVIS